ncbi:hypothetical protein LWI28_011983 [Acer negundo]|uniref:Uncharacterized protein n=1 Tax=Acer negundo TaxID=4023 RepID=A0AAD5JCW7_ACENE|nr:hypothetical protein LWI28_011983 [Acer negundo]
MRGGSCDICGVELYWWRNGRVGLDPIADEMRRGSSWFTAAQYGVGHASSGSFITRLEDDIRLDMRVKQPKTRSDTISVAHLIKERNILGGTPWDSLGCLYHSQ